MKAQTFVFDLATGQWHQWGTLPEGATSTFSIVSVDNVEKVSGSGTEEDPGHLNITLTYENTESAGADQIQDTVVVPPDVLRNFVYGEVFDNSGNRITSSVSLQGVAFQSPDPSLSTGVEDVVGEGQPPDWTVRTRVGPFNGDATKNIIGFASPFNVSSYFTVSLDANSAGNDYLPDSGLVWSLVVTYQNGSTELVSTEIDPPSPTQNVVVGISLSRDDVTQVNISRNYAKSGEIASGAVYQIAGFSGSSSSTFIIGPNIPDSELVDFISGDIWSDLVNESFQDGDAIFDVTADIESGDYEDNPFATTAVSLGQLYAEMGMWGFSYGVFWQELQGDKGQSSYSTVVGSAVSSALFRIDPTAEVDNAGTEDAQFIRRTVTGGLSVRGRTFVPQYDFNVVASVGDPAQAGAAIAMRFSDDNGNSWTTPPNITLQAGAWNQELTWRSLGVIRAPVRIFEITDIGGLVRLSGIARARVAGEDDE